MPCAVLPRGDPAADLRTQPTSGILISHPITSVAEPRWGKGAEKLGFAPARKLVEGRAFEVPSLRQDLLDACDRLVDRLRRADAFGHDAVDRVAPDVLVRDRAQLPAMVPNVHV